MKVRHLRSAKLLAVIAVLLSALIPLSPALAAPITNYTAINGSGSTWSSVALDQWAQNLHANGITINFNPDGSAAGRADYMAQQVDFAASDPPFRTGSDPFNTGGGEHPNVGYSYVPDTAGGTAFMYHIDVAGKLITNLRLSGQTIMKIFTGQITNWDDPAITKDYGAKLPSLPIIPVVRADGSGATFFFTRWMAHEFPAQWNAFCRRIDSHVALPCGQTEFYPQGWGQAKAAERLQQCRLVHHRQLRPGHHWLRRVCLRAQLALSGGQGAQPGRLLRAAERVQRGGRADQGGDQLGSQQPGLPAAEPG